MHVYTDDVPYRPHISNSKIKQVVIILLQHTAIMTLYS